MRIGIVWVVLSFLAGCAQTPQQPVHAIDSDQYPSEIARLEAIVVENPDSTKAWQARYQLAQRYMSYNNPRRNYKKALENLQLYVSHNPTAADDPNLQNWLAALKEIQLLSDNKRIAQLNAKLWDSGQTNLALKYVNRELEKRNEDLNKKIEMLKTLDHTVEEKRKTYNTE
jgi:hypothetical protein